MKASASCSERPAPIKQCRLYWRGRGRAFEPDLMAFCRVSLQPPPECISDQPGCCKGRVLLRLHHALYRRVLPEVQEELLWHAVFGHPFAATNRVVSADFVRGILTTPALVGLVHPNGIRITNITVEGDLHLQSITIAFPLFITDSEFTGGVILTDADTRSTSFAGSRCAYISAQRVKVHGSLSLTKSRCLSSIRATRTGRLFEAKGVNLEGAEIFGDLDCSGGSFEDRDDSEDGRALNMRSVTVHGAVRLSQVEKNDRHPFTVAGQVLAVGMTVHGDFDCTNGRIANPLRHAISLDRSTIGGSVFFRNGFRAHGQVRLLGTTINSNLDCSGGTFLNSRDATLVARNAVIDKNVYLSGSLHGTEEDGEAASSFETNGPMILDSARVGGDLIIGRCDENQVSLFQNNGESRTALNGDTIDIRHATIHGAISCDADFGKCRTLSLDHTNAESVIFTSDARLWPQGISLTRFRYNYLDFLATAANDSCTFRTTAPQKRGRGECLERSKCFINWLEHAEYSPDQYEHLASILRKSGSPREANKVLRASRERARAESREQEDWLRWILMFFEKYTIGYGIGMGYFWALLWVIVLTLIGTGVLVWMAKADGGFQLFYASLDNILPVIKINYRDDTRNVINGLERWPLFIFNFLKVGGCILAVFLAAGFAGFTQRR